MKTALTLIVLVLLGISWSSNSATAPRSGAQVYQTYCGVCHSGGWQGAPIANDKKEWDERVAKGFDAMFKNAIAAGATVKMPLDNMFWGDRYGKLTDPFGHDWELSREH